METKRKGISVSEIAQFHYCPVSWYLQKQGFQPASSMLRKGERTHQQLGLHLKKAKKTDRTIFILRVFALILFITALVFLLVGGMI